MRFFRRLRAQMGVVLLIPVAVTVQADHFGGRNNGTNFEGAVYAMTNKFDRNSVVAYGRKADGSLQLIGEFETGGSGATSTLPFNAENRNLPSAIAFEVVEDEGDQFVVVTEAREFQADGTPPAFPALQTGSVSTWKLGKHGELTSINLDILTGTGQFDGERTACWIEFSRDTNTFRVSNALESTLSTFLFNEGEIELVTRVEVSGVPPSDTDPFGTTDGWIDLWASDDGEYLNQLYGLDGTIGVFKIEDNGAGTDLTLIEEVRGDLPPVNTQGIVAF